MVIGGGSLARRRGRSFLGGDGSWFFLTLEGLVYGLPTVGDEVHIGGYRL